MIRGLFPFKVSYFRTCLKPIRATSGFAMNSKLLAWRHVTSVLKWRLSMMRALPRLPHPIWTWTCHLRYHRSKKIGMNICRTWARSDRFERIGWDKQGWCRRPAPREYRLVSHQIKHVNHLAKILFWYYMYVKESFCSPPSLLIWHIAVYIDVH